MANRELQEDEKKYTMRGLAMVDKEIENASQGLVDIKMHLDFYIEDMYMDQIERYAEQKTKLIEEITEIAQREALNTATTGQIRKLRRLERRVGILDRKLSWQLRRNKELETERYKRLKKDHEVLLEEKRSIRSQLQSHIDDGVPQKKQ